MTSVDLASAAAVPLLVPRATIVAVALLLAVVTIALAGPVPVALARASWPSRSPVLALLLWQAIGLAGGLSMIGALALAGLALAPAHPRLAMIPAAGFTAYLLTHLGVTMVRASRQRRRHLALLDLLASPHPTDAATRVLDD